MSSHSAANPFGQSDFVRRSAATAAVRALEAVGWSLIFAEESLSQTVGCTTIHLAYGRSDQEQDARQATLMISFARDRG